MADSTLLIAQMSDAHVGTRPGFLGGRSDTVAALDPAPDVVLFTGDLAEHGRSEEYAAVAETLAPLSMPVYAVPGNHDEPILARETLARYLPVAADSPGQACYHHVRQTPLHLVALDTVMPRRSHEAVGGPPDRAGPAARCAAARTAGAAPGLAAPLVAGARPVHPPELRRALRRAAAALRF